MYVTAAIQQTITSNGKKANQETNKNISIIAHIHVYSKLMQKSKMQQQNILFSLLTND
jgi:hypothetical protein